MDLKPLNNIHIYQQDTAMQLLLDPNIKMSLLRIFSNIGLPFSGAPNKILSDNRGEFNNQELQDMSENLNIKIMTTPPESPWSNGVCEHHNAVIGDMVTKIVVETKCPLEIERTSPILRNELPPKKAILSVK